MKKRKGFISIEILLIIGVLVSVLAGVFIMYKKIQANIAANALIIDIATIMNGLQRYKGATGAYPISSQYGGKSLLTDEFLSGADGFNAGSAYIDSSTSSKWEYWTILYPGSEMDPDSKTNRGAIIINPSEVAYSALKISEINDILRGKCLNGTKEIAGRPAVGDWRGDCVIYVNTPILRFNRIQ